MCCCHCIFRFLCRVSLCVCVNLCETPSAPITQTIFKTVVLINLIKILLYEIFTNWPNWLFLFYSFSFPFTPCYNCISMRITCSQPLLWIISISRRNDAKKRKRFLKPSLSLTSQGHIHIVSFSLRSCFNLIIWKHKIYIYNIKWKERREEKEKLRRCNSMKAIVWTIFVE